MSEMIIYRIIIGVAIVAILWLYFRRNKVNQVDDSAVLEKEIEGLQKEKEGDCAQSRIAQPGNNACKVIFNFIEIKGKCDHGQTV